MIFNNSVLLQIKNFKIANTKPCINHVFIKTLYTMQYKIDFDSIIFYANVSDHFLPFIYMSQTKKSTEKKIINFINHNKLKDLLIGESWNNMLTVDNSQLSCE